MKTVTRLAIILFAVTGLTLGAWAQDQGYDNGSNGNATPVNDGQNQRWRRIIRKGRTAKVSWHGEE